MTTHGHVSADRPILVVGTGGSGTSTVARLVAGCGVFMGAILAGADEDNPYGLCEDAEFVALNRALLEGSILVPQWRQRIDGLIEARRVLERPWGVKDPRISELLPLYIQLFENPVFIRCRRNLEDAARSLSRRFGQPYGHTLTVARTRDAQLDRWLTGQRVLEIEFEAIVAGKAGALIREFLESGAVGGSRGAVPSAAVSTLLHRAVERHRTGDLRQAEADYRKVLAQEPSNADALSLLGTLFLTRGQFDAALSHSMEAVALRPEEATFASRLGSAYQARGEADKARQCFERALTLQPGRPEAHNSLGLIHKDSGSIQAAERHFRAAIAAAPDQPLAYSNLGALLQEAYRLEEAEGLLRKALELDPEYAHAHLNLANTLRLAGRFAESETYVRRALALREPFPDAHNSLGMLLRLRGATAEAQAAFERALELRPDYPEARANLNLLGYELGLSHGGALALSGFDRDALALSANAVIALLHDPAPTADETAARIREFGAGIEAAIQPSPPAAASRGRRLRIGFLSGDLRRNPAYHFTEPVLAGLDRNRFEVFAYPHIQRQDRYSRILSGLVDHWRDITTLDDHAAADLIRADDLDLLIVASGYFEGGRMGVAARAPAPRLINYPSFPATCGMQRVGWRLTDVWCDPPGTSEHHYIERLVRVDGGHLCYRAPENTPDVAPMPCKDNGFVTFGSFNRLSKLNDGVIDTWARILALVPRSRLYLKTAQFSDAASRQHIAERFASHGIAPHRLDLEPYRDDLAAHMADYGRVDIALDTFPYSGQTTTCEALWMGVPVVALRGDRYVARVSGGLLTRIGEPGLVADDAEEYCAIAAALAGDETRLAALRQNLRGAMTASTLANPEAFAPRLAAAFAEILSQ